MISAKIPDNETERLNALKKYQILDTDHESDFNDIVELASQICNTAISLISLVDEKRQWFKAKVGLEPDETSRDIAFCSHSILEQDIMIVPDASVDKRFFDNPLVKGYPKIKFYAGIPLKTPEGYNIGTLCVIDSNKKVLDEKQIFGLKILAKQIIDKLELKLKNRSLHEALIAYQRQGEELSSVNDFNTKLHTIISHDLRSPIANLITLTSLLSENLLSPEEYKSNLADLNKNLISTLEMLDKLLKWGLLKLGEGQINKELVNINTLLNNEIMFLEQFTKTKENSVFVEIEPELNLNSDSNMLQFIFRNLIQNANKFTLRGRIRIYSKFIPGFIEFFVEDNGKGIESDLLETLFVRKSQSRSYGTSGEKGSGLGLLIVKEFVEKLGGTINAASEPGKGSTFKFTLPI